MQTALSEKLEAIAETLGILLPGMQVTLDSNDDRRQFRVDGKAICFTEEFLKAHDIDYILTLCHAAVSELKARPTTSTINVTGPAQLP